VTIVLIGCAVLVLLVGLWVMRSGPADETCDWRVVVENATKRHEDYEGFSSTRRVNGKVSVCLRRGRKERMSLYVIEVADPAFEDRLREARLNAEERAAALNAAAAGL
jgi:hypothetical protein